MKRRVATALCVLSLSLCIGAKAAPQATLPPDLPATVAAPQADLPIWLYAAEDRVGALERVTATDADIVVSGQIDADSGNPEARVDALWHIDPVTGIASRLYQARAGVRILTPVLCGGRLYWAEIREEQRAQWRILTWNRDRDKAELVRQNPGRRSDILPLLSTDGERVYWYESDEGFFEEEYAQVLSKKLYALTPDTGKTEMFVSVYAPVDGLPPSVQGGLLTTGMYMNDGLRVWKIWRIDPKDDCKTQELQLWSKAFDAQSTAGGRVFWRQASGDDIDADEDERAIGDQAQAEEAPMQQTPPADASMESQLWMGDLGDAGSKPIDLHAAAEALLVRPEGAYFVNDARALCLYSFALDRVLKLTAFSDYLPTLSAQGSKLTTLRAIDDGQAVHYRVAVIDVSALQTPGWPPLQ